MGDFSFKKDINNDLLPIIEKYETSYEALGSEIVSDIAENPSIYTKLTSILDTLSRKYLLYSNSVKKAYQSLALLPASIASKPALSFIMATLSKDDADDLLKLGDMATIKLSSLPYYLTFGMRKEADLIAQVYTKCVYNISESIEKLLKGLHKNEMQKITLEMRSKGYTLEQIGQQYGKSRERIRQIEARARRYFDHWNAHSKIMYFLSALLDSKEVILEDELIPFLGEHSEEVLYLLKSSDISIYSYIADMKYVKPAFEDLLARLQTDYIDIGMIHFVDTEEDWNSLQNSDFLNYVLEMKEKGIIHHIGMSSHDPKTSALAVKSGLIEMLMFSVNPAFDMLPSGQDLGELLEEGYHYDNELAGINTERAELYKLCEEYNVGITVMKGFAACEQFTAL